MVLSVQRCFEKCLSKCFVCNCRFGRCSPALYLDLHLNIAGRDNIPKVPVSHSAHFFLAISYETYLVQYIWRLGTVRDECCPYPVDRSYYSLLTVVKRNLIWRKLILLLVNFSLGALAAYWVESSKHFRVAYFIGQNLKLSTAPECHILPQTR
jgi:hypothetical protein